MSIHNYFKSRKLLLYGILLLSLLIVLLGVFSVYFFRQVAADFDHNKISYSFSLVLWFPVLLFLVFSWIYFGRFELGLVAFIPVISVWFLTLGLITILNLKFNIINLIFPLCVFVSSCVFSISVLNRSIKEYSFGRKASNPGILLPGLYRWLTVKKGKKRIMPITGSNILNSAYSFTAFLIGSFFHSLFGFLLFKLTRPSDKKKLLFHRNLAFIAGFVVKRLPGVRTRVINRPGEDFNKPAIIICNHQSHIDLMLIMMLSPRIIILTNEWVWNSPFYGNIVKYADFYPVINGIEGGIEHLSRLIDKGYSIMIFPEGTRSEDCSINRFHRGAFFLAEKLNLDLLPVIIHGMGHVLPKTDFLLRKGAVTVEILDRISQGDMSFGESYTQRAKLIRKMYISHYQKLANEIETPGYYSDKLFHNYIYKGAAVSTQVKIDLKKHGNYSSIIKQLPDNGKVLIFGAGLGSFSLLLSMVKPELLVDAIDDDEDKLALARHCASCTDQISYICGDPLNYLVPRSYDAIVLVDCLSLFDNSDQIKILRNCLKNAPLVLISDIEYFWNYKIRFMLRGIEVRKLKNYSLFLLEQLSEGLSVNIIQKDNIFALSRMA